MAKFVSKYKQYAVKLRSGRKEVTNGVVTRISPVFARFRNGLFDTQGPRAGALPMSEDEIIKKLRNSNSYNKKFYEIGKNPKSAEDLLEIGIRDLEEAVETVNDPVMIKQAMQADDRKSAQPIYERRIKNM